MLKGYLTTKEAAGRLGVSVGRVQQLIAAQRLSAIKVGQTNLVKESDLQLVRDRQNGRPPKAKKERNVNGEKTFKTIFDICPEVIGSIKSGLPGDVSTNKEYLKDLGAKSAGRKGSIKRG